MWMNAASLESGGDRSLREWASANGANASSVSRRPPIERSQPRKPRKGGDAAIRHGMAETKGRGLQRLTAPQRDETIIARREVLRVQPSQLWNRRNLTKHGISHELAVEV